MLRHLRKDRSGRCEANPHPHGTGYRPPLQLALYGHRRDSHFSEMSKVRSCRDYPEMDNPRRNGSGTTHIHYLRGGVQILCQACGGELTWSGIGWKDGTLYITFLCRDCMTIHLLEMPYAYDPRGLQQFTGC